jgi:hypothetical protein
MTTRGATMTGLSPEDIDRIRAGLGAGRRPKVVFTEAAGQVAGQVGQVVALADPDQADDWLVVRFGRDELPFSPADLSVPPRARPGARAGRPAPKDRPAKVRPVAAAPPASPAGSLPPPAGPVAEPRTTGAPPQPDPASPARRPAKRATRAARAATARPPASMTVTLAYQAGEWTVAAHQGSRTLAKPYLVRPADALKMVAMLDVPGVHDAVEQIVTAELAQAQRRAETLRSELAEVEARLAELREVS